MPKFSQFRPVAFLTLTRLSILVGICILLCPYVASASPTDIVTFHFSGSLTCDPLSSSPCSPNTGALTGTFSIDVSTDSIVGPWSVSTPIGTISSSGPGPATEIFGVSPTKFGPLPLSDATLVGVVLENFLGNNNIFVFDVFFVSSSTDVIGSFAPGNPPVPNDPPGTVFVNGIALDNLGTDLVYDVTAANVSTTPEPSSLLLLGSGLLGLAGLKWRRIGC